MQIVAHMHIGPWILAMCKAVSNESAHRLGIIPRATQSHPGKYP